MGKRQEIELLRIVSAFGVVWFHSSDLGKDIAYSGLISFLLLSLYFSAKSGSNQKPVLARVRRLLVPWIIWLFFYGALNVIFHKPFIKTDNGLIAGILAGSSIHLWYMPFIFTATVIFDFIKKYVNGTILVYICSILAVLTFVMTGFWRPWSLELGYPWAQYAHAFAGILVGVVFANSGSVKRPVAAGLMVLTLIAVALFGCNAAGIGVPYLLGITAAMLVLLPRWNLHAAVNIQALSECTLGIYLSHIFWLMVIRKTGFPFESGLPFAVFAVSAVTVWCFRKIAPRISGYVV
jgi:hypothetical protein